MHHSFLERMRTLFLLQRPRARRSSRSSINTFEPRTLLATLVSATKLTYQDVDGDNVEVTFSKPVLTPAVVNTIFTFDTGTVDGSNATKQQLRTIDVSGFIGAAIGISGSTITTKAVRSSTNGGDGFAAIGQIQAAAQDLGAVTIDGDLGRIVAGNSDTTTQGLGTLTVHSIGRFGTFTGATNLDSVIQGKLQSLKSKTDVKDVFIDVQGGADGKIGSITIGGSLIGGAVSNSGRISSSGDIGAVIITGNLIGGNASNSGHIRTAQKLASATIGGALIGGAGVESGQIFASGDMGVVKITGDLRGGGGSFSGSIRSNGKLAGVTVGGSQIGGAGSDSGQIASSGDITGAVKVTGNVQGGAGGKSGSILAVSAVPRKIASVTINGSLLGGNGLASGNIRADAGVGPVIVKGDVVGGSGVASGSIQSFFNITSVSIGGSLVGGGANDSGSVQCGDLNTLSITGDIRGGSATGSSSLLESGSVRAKRVGTMTLSGSLIAGTDGTSGSFENNGAIRTVNDIGNLTIKGSIIGNVTNRAIITARGQSSPSGTTDLAIGKLTVDGSVENALIHAGIALFSNPHSSDAQIGPVVIGKDWIASNLVAGAFAGGDGLFGTGDDVKISGGGAKDVATVFSKIASVTIGGQVIGTAGAGDHFGFVAENIGSFKVKGGTTTFPLLTGNGNDDFLVNLFGDIRVNEI